MSNNLQIDISDIDECSETDPCTESLNCVNTPGDYKCICNGHLTEPFCGEGIVNKPLFMCLFLLPVHSRIFVQESVTQYIHMTHQRRKQIESGGGGSGGEGGARLLRNVDKQNKNHIGFGYNYVYVYNYVKHGEGWVKPPLWFQIPCDFKLHRFFI